MKNLSYLGLPFLPYLYILHFYSPLQLQQPNCVFRIYSATLNILLRVAFVKSIILSFLAHFVKNKKHTNLNTYLVLYRNQKQNENKRVQHSLYKPKLLHFFDFEQKTPFRSNASSKKRASGKTLPVTMAILISF